MGGNDVSEQLSAGVPAAELPAVSVSVADVAALLGELDGVPDAGLPAVSVSVADVAAVIRDRAVVDAGAWLAAPVAEPDWLLRVDWDAWFDKWPLVKREPGYGVLRQGVVGLLAAAGGSGKSQLLVQLLLSVVLGVPFVSAFRAAVGGVGCVWAEEDGAELHRRIRRALGDGPVSGANRSDFTARVRVLPARRLPVALLRDVQEWRVRADGIRTAEVVCTATAFADALGEWLERVAPVEGYRLIVLDPSARFAPAAAETDNAVATRYVEALERLTDLPGNPTVLLAHHTAKGVVSGQGAARGASALVDGVRFMWLLVRQQAPKRRKGADDTKKQTFVDGTLELSTVKTNYAMAHVPLLLRWSRGVLCAVNPRTDTVEQGEVVL